MGRRLAKILEASSEGGGHGDAAAQADAAAGGGVGGKEGGGRKGGRDEKKEEEAAVAAEVLGRGRRPKEVEPLDLEVIDDRDFYQHLLKVCMHMYIYSMYGGGGRGLSSPCKCRGDRQKRLLQVVRGHFQSCTSCA